jgi:hypothetical protein
MMDDNDDQSEHAADIFVKIDVYVSVENFGYVQMRLIGKHGRRKETTFA